MICLCAIFSIYFDNFHMLCRGWHPLCELILICVYRVIVIWVIIVRIWHIDLP